MKTNGSTAMRWGKQTDLFLYNSVLKISVNRISNTVPHSLLCYMAEKTTSL